MYFRGKKINTFHPSVSRRLGIQAVHQQVGLVDTLSVERNMVLGDEPLKGGFFIDKKIMRERTLAMFEEIGIYKFAPSTLVGGMIIGCINGLIVSYLEIPSLVVTLGSLFLFRGITIAASNAQAAFSFSITRDIRESPIVRLFGGGEVLDYNNAIIWVIFAVMVVQYIFFLHPLGNKILAVSGDVASAKSRGVRTSRIIWAVFIVSGLFAGLAGVIEASKLGHVDGASGRLMELQAIAVVVLGGRAAGRANICDWTLVWRFHLIHHSELSGDSKYSAAMVYLNSGRNHCYCRLV